MQASRAIVAVLGVGMALALGAGCKTAPPKQAGEDDPVGSDPASTPEDGGKSDVEQPGLSDPSNNLEKGTSGDTPKTPDPVGMEGLDEDTKAQFKVALRRGKDKAAECSSVVKSAPAGKGEVQVTFDGKKGRATDATVGSPFAGTEVESCIKKSFIGEVVIPFDGAARTVSQEVELKATAPAAPDAKKPPAKK
jgi:hypothetical protein